MKDYVIRRVLDSAEYIVCYGATLRDTAKHFGIGKSTVHTDMQNKLREIDYGLYLEVKAVLEVNLTTRHLRGGESTRQRYKDKLIIRHKKA